MNYRNEAAGIEMYREEHEEAKAMLEDWASKIKLFELANRKYVIDLPSGEGGLQTMGFQKEAAKIPNQRYGPIMMYCRETADGIELLVDCDLAKIDDKTPHLYHLPAGQNIEEWFRSVPDLTYKRDHNAALLGYGGLLTLVSTISAISLPYSIDLAVSLFAGLSTFVVGMGYYSGGFNFRKLMRKGLLGKELVAEGQEALKYIA
ncbi:MAG: hypothetical protein AABX24_02045, partial [Nanoarchaeota archaeon]